MIALSIYRFNIELNHTVQCEFKLVFDATIHTVQDSHSKFLSNVYNRYGFPWFRTNSLWDLIINRFHHISFLFVYRKKSTEKKTEFFISFDKKRPSVARCCSLFIQDEMKKKNCFQNYGFEVDYSRSLFSIVGLLSIHFFICVPLLYNTIFEYLTTLIKFNVTSRQAFRIQKHQNLKCHYLMPHCWATSAKNSSTFLSFWSSFFFSLVCKLKCGISESVMPTQMTNT